MNDRKEEIMYYQIKKICISCFAGILLFLSCYNVKIKRINENIDLLFLGYAIITCVVLLILRITYILNESRCIYMLIYIYICMLLEEIAGMVRFNILNQYCYEMQESFLIFLFCSALYFLYYLSYSKSEKNRFIFTALSLVIFYILIGISYFLGYRQMSILVLNIFSILFNFVVANKYKKYKVYNVSYINIIKVLNIFIYVIAILNIINLFIHINNEYLLFIIKGISFIVYFVCSVEIIKKSINRPYKNVFNNLNVNNIAMNELNLKIIEQNIELECVHSMIMNKDKLLDSFFRNIPIPLVIINRDSERIIFSNSSFLELVEKDSMREVINKKIFSIIKMEDLGFIKDIHSIIRGEYEGKEGTKYIDIEILDDEDNSDEVIILFNDVSDKIRILKIKEDIKNRNFEENLKKDFLSNISHDLKTPINVLYSAAQLTDVFCKEDNYAGIERYLEISKKNCISLIHFTENLIDRSKMISEYLTPKISCENIVEVVEETVMSLVEYAKNKKINLIFDTDEEEIFVYIDPEFIQRITMNIISNSIKYVNENGEIYVYIKDMDDEVQIIFNDNGIGMDEEILNNAFNRYSMGENSSLIREKGTGIGLFVVKKLVEEQKGKIKIESKVNEGTTIEIIFKKVTINEK